MKIQGPDKASSTSSSKKSSKAKSGDGSFGVMLSGDEGTSQTASTGAAQTLTNVEALLIAQSTDDPAGRASKGRMMVRADKLLDELDKLRLNMLTGNMTVGDMIDLADVVASNREGIDDPELAAILQEIDLRAQIEIAKMRVSLESVE